MGSTSSTPSAPPSPPTLQRAPSALSGSVLQAQIDTLREAGAQPLLTTAGALCQANDCLRMVRQKLTDWTLTSHGHPEALRSDAAWYADASGELPTVPAPLLAPLGSPAEATVKPLVLPDLPSIPAGASAPATSVQNKWLQEAITHAVLFLDGVPLSTARDRERRKSLVQQLQAVAAEASERYGQVSAPVAGAGEDA